MAYQTVKQAMKAMADNVRSTYFPTNYSDSLSFNEMVNSVLGRPVNIGNLNNGLALMADHLRHGSTDKMTLEQIINAIQPVWTGNVFAEENTWPLYGKTVPLSLVPNTNLDKLEKVSECDVLVSTHLSQISFAKSDGSGTAYSYEEAGLNCYLVGNPDFQGQVFKKEISSKVYQIDILWRIPKGTSSNSLKQGIAIKPIKDVTMVVGEYHRFLAVRILP